MDKLFVYLESSSKADEAMRLAEKLGVPLIDGTTHSPRPENEGTAGSPRHETEGAAGSSRSERKNSEKSAPGDPSSVYLIEGTEGLSISDGKMRLLPDLSDMADRIRPGRLGQELLVHAAKTRSSGPRPVAMDCTAGLGEDSLLLAAAGFEVYLFEKDPVIAALLADALRRAAEDARLAEAVGRMHFQEGDSLWALHALQESGSLKSPDAFSEEASEASLPHPDASVPHPDVIYLDPMFPARRKSGLIGKKFQLLHHLETPCNDEETLFTAARNARPLKVIIKRPLKGPYLAGVKPSWSLRGKAIRYDCILTNSQPALSSSASASAIES